MADHDIDGGGDGTSQSEAKGGSQSRPASDLDELSRRSFLQAAVGTGVAAAAAAGMTAELARIGRYTGRESAYETKGYDAELQRPDHWAEIDLNINGVTEHLRVQHRRSLLLALREDLGLTGTKKSCNTGECGACTVLMDGLPIYSCMTLAMDAAGHDVQTIEGLGQDGRLHAVQQAFIENMGSQCGACTPGMIMAGAGVLLANPKPTAEDVKLGLSGVLCRCGNYPHEIASILAASGQSAAPPRRAASAKSGTSQLDSGIAALDAPEKAAGTARYTGDIGLHAGDEVQNALCVKVVRSPYPNAEVMRIDDSRAQQLPGYRGMVTFADVPGYKPEFKAGGHDPGPVDRYMLNGRVRYVGDAIAAVAADDPYIAQQALNLLTVEFKRLEPYPDAEFNLANAVQMVQPDTVAGFGGPQPADKPTIEYKSGNLDEGYRQADVITEGRYETQIQCHVPIETHTAIASWTDGKLTLWDTQQSVHHARTVLASALQVPEADVRVVCNYLGGGFGGKCTDTPGKTLYQGIAALLARKTGKPARLEYTLKEELLAEDTRNPFVFYMKTGVKKDGTLTALECKAIARTGAYASSGPAVVAVAGPGIVDTYRVPHYWYHGYCVYTNSPVGGEFRGFGHPQAVFAREAHMDKVAEAIGMDPVQFRLKNTLKTGDPIVTDTGGTVPLFNIGAEECLRKGAESIGWSNWRAPAEKQGRVRRGLGVRFSQEHTGRSSSNGLVWRDRNGKFHVPLGVGNIGTLAHTGIALVVAETLGVPVGELDVTWGDTSRSAWDFVTDASRALHCHGKAMVNAALDLKRQMQGEKRPAGDFAPRFDPAYDINPLLDENTGKTEMNPMPVLHPGTLEMARKIVADGGLAGLGFYVWNPGVEAWGASFADVEVDMETGQVTVLKLACAHDIGRVIHRPAAEAQVHGGTVMGLGFAMTEELVTDPHNGIPVNQTLYEYRPPSILDVPEIIPILVEAPVEAGPFGAKGLGENPMFNAAAAVANAVYNASGVRIDSLPLTWRRVYDALKSGGKLMV